MKTALEFYAVVFKMKYDKQENTEIFNYEVPAMSQFLDLKFNDECEYVVLQFVTITDGVEDIEILKEVHK